MRVRDIAVAFPSRQVSSETIAQWTGSDPVFISEKIGIARRAFLAPDEPPLGLARQACENLFARNPAIAPKQVGLIVVVTQNPDYKLPHTSALLQNAISASPYTAAFDINLGCSGWVYALTIVKGFMAAEQIKDAILVTCDPYSRIMDQTDKDTVTLFGDAATATWLSVEEGAEIGRLDFGTDGAGANSLIVKAGGSAAPLTSLWSRELPRTPPEDLRLKMHGRAIFNFMMERVPASVERCLDRNGLARSDIDLFVFHQASKYLLDNLQRRMGLDPAQVPCNLREVGNTVSSSIPLLLSQLKDQGVVKGKRILVSGFGVGLSWATNILSFQEN